MSHEQAEKTIVSAIQGEGGKRIRIKTKEDADKGPPEKVKVKGKNGKTVEVAVPEMTPGLSNMVWADTIGLSKREARAFFKEHPEYRPARREVGDRVRGLCEDGLSWLPRQTAKLRHSGVGSAVGILIGAGITGAVGYLLYGDYQARKGL